MPRDSNYAKENRASTARIRALVADLCEREVLHPWVNIRR